MIRPLSLSSNALLRKSLLSQYAILPSPELAVPLVLAVDQKNIRGLYSSSSAVMNNIIANGRGIDFDPDIVDAFMLDRDKVEEIYYSEIHI